MLVDPLLKTKKESHLIISYIVGLFANTLTADCKNSLHNWENLPQQTQIPFSKKWKVFPEFYEFHI